jgi:peptide/nickel transport system ATP-binding protein
MYLGKMCELAPPDALYAAPAHPYTAALLSSIPVPDPMAPPRPGGLVEGELPSPLAPPSGCRFRTRCPRAEERCALEEPQMRPVGDDQYVACHFPLVGGVAPPQSSETGVSLTVPDGNGAGSETSGETDSPSDARAGLSDVVAPAP